MSSTAEDPLITRREGPVAILTLSNPGKRNALSQAMRLSLLHALQTLNRDDTCRAIIITGAGDHFCSGGDISEMESRTLMQSRERMETVTSLARVMITGPKPIVAALEGTVAGAGISIAASADFVISAQNARFSCAFIKVGLLPDMGGLWSITQRVGPAKARELFGLGETFSADEALRIGLVNRVMPAGQAINEALRIANIYASQPPVATALLREVMARGIDTLEDALASETNHQPILRLTGDHMEAVAVFRNRQAPC